MKKSNGFGAMEIIMALAVVVIVGAVGYVAWSKFVAKNDTSTSLSDQSGSTKTSDQQDATPITSAKDLDSAVKTLDSTSLDDSDTAAAESQANF